MKYLLTLSGLLCCAVLALSCSPTQKTYEPASALTQADTAPEGPRPSPRLYDLILGWVTVLQEHEAPVDGLPVRFEFADELTEPSWMGEAVWEGDGYVVRLRTDIPESQAIPVLLHEWAHVRTMRLAPGHSAVWGVEFARIWRIATGEL